MSSRFFVELKDRGAVLVSGPDRRSFLQALITNDVDLLETQDVVYACLLTPQGKFLYDFFMTEQDDTITLECEGGTRARTLMTRLNYYKLRAKVTLECIEKVETFAILHPGLKSAEISNPSDTYVDPRHPEMGFRTVNKPLEQAEHPFAEWDRHRISLGIPDGSRDLEPEKSTLEDGNMDRLNGVSYTKGCYIGQELTAKVHHRGLAKRHLMAIKPIDPGVTTLPVFGADIRGRNTLIGEMRSSCGNIGLALIKDEALPLLETAGFAAVSQ